MSPTTQPRPDPVVMKIDRKSVILLADVFRDTYALDSLVPCEITSIIPSMILFVVSSHLLYIAFTEY